MKFSIKTQTKKQTGVFILKNKIPVVERVMVATSTVTSEPATSVVSVTEGGGSSVGGGFGYDVGGREAAVRVATTTLTI